MNDLNKRTLSLSRTFNAPIELVWQAWTQPEHIAQWWGPKGMKTKVISHDFSVGGTWKYSMLMPDSNEFISEGVYTEIIEHKKISSSANFKPMTEGVEIQALFEKNGDKTNFTFNVVHPTEEYCLQQEKMGFMNGWGSVFDRLKEFVETI
ncbi:activator of HSP90 ATPase [Aquimarina sp. AD1]|uniref:SRPBCC family protein n=1 Tax=Aquimarina sp. (strain AD1) TaxID=1714848 RepID=UPI000E4861E6|nr:SRPBCC domain-containing protein [Aquimarina sp. AD1]AXT54962.1 activator of HSP90 ATPase [Aquimarina sp. AD1]RKN20364.1 activator of HSP90 ATPase [Aquimarina sp. AD1]